MGLTHDQLVEHEKNKYSKKWITITELRYGGYIFDLFAFNPETKEVIFTEVDVTSKTDTEKIAYAKTLGKVRVVCNKYAAPEPSNNQLLADALGNPIRMEMLNIVAAEGQSYGSLLFHLRMIPRKDAGRFAYHLKMMLKTGLIEVKGKKYVISEKGVKILEFLKTL